MMDNGQDISGEYPDGSALPQHEPDLGTEGTTPPEGQATPNTAAELAELRAQLKEVREYANRAQRQASKA